VNKAHHLVALFGALFLLIGCPAGDDDDANGDDDNADDDDDTADDDDDTADDDDDTAGDDDTSDDDDTADDDDTSGDDDTDTCDGCLIDQICYPDGDPDPTNPCQACDASLSDSAWTPLDGTPCDDGLACTDNVCHTGVCVTTPLYDCDWPAESCLGSTNLTSIEGTVLDNDFYSNLSGAVWNPVARTLWVCRNGGPSKLWAVVEDGSGGYEIDYQGNDRAEWEEFGDLEGLALADFNEPNTVYLMVEGHGDIWEYDFSTYSAPVQLNDFDTGPYLSGGDGAEAITFVPDSFLSDQGFVDGSGAPYVSTQGMGGLMFIGHQSDGRVYAFDLNRTTGDVVFVGDYFTDRDETAGMEFDRSTGLLYILHGGSHNVVEVASMSSTLVGKDRKLDTIKVYTGPAPVPLMGDNYEGFAVVSKDDCVADQRSAFLTIDGGNIWSLLEFQQFPCE
jgi:hypothetical protein